MWRMDMQTQGEGEGETNWELRIDIYKLPRVKEKASENLLQKLSLVLGDDLGGEMGVEWEGDATGRGCMSTYSRFTYCTAEANTVKQLYSKKKKKNQHLEIKDHHKPELDMLNIGQKKKTVQRNNVYKDYDYFQNNQDLF